MPSAYEIHGAFSWTELMTTDVAGARKFYSNLFGWKIKDMDSSAMEYGIISTGDKEEGIGGIMAVPQEAQGMPSSWGTYVTVKNVDDVAGRAAGLGGKVLAPPQDIPGVGRFAVIQDPQGATLSIITYLPR
jgi:predicted enzyme related to lactoylglutathione lyase